MRGIFFKFCEPLEKVRARFSEKKILPKKAHCPERTFLGAARTCDSFAPLEVHARQLRAISEHLDVACVKLD